MLWSAADDDDDDDDDDELEATGQSDGLEADDEDAFNWYLS